MTSSRYRCRQAFWSILTTLAFLFIDAGTAYSTATDQRSLGPRARAEFLPDQLIVKFASPLASPSAAGGPAALSALALPGNCTAILAKARARELVQMFPEKLWEPAISTAANELASIYEIRFESAIDIPKIAGLLGSQPDVLYAEPYYLRYPAYEPNDPARTLQNYLSTIRAREGWDISRGDSSIVIAIVDTGVDWMHEDLSANIWKNPREIPGNNVDDDSNGYIDDVHGWDFGGLDGTADNDPREDQPDHGTHVAGIAAAVTDNNTGVAGVAFRARIMPVKASRHDIRLNGRAAITYGYRGIVYAADNGATIINCSWGGSGYSRFEQEVTNYATSRGALVVAAAGNGGSSEKFYPAAYGNVLAVAATDNNDIHASFSNFGHWVGISAPGLAIYNVWQTNSYAYLSGTSMSAPMAAGVCALVKAANTAWSPLQIAQQVRVSAQNIDAANPAFAKKLGFGRLDALRALTVTSPGVRWIAMSVSEIRGDQDGVIAPDEDIGVGFTLVNYLQRADNLSLSASTTDPYISITSSTLALGSLAGNDTLTTAGMITFHVAPGAPSNHRVDFLLDIVADGYTDWQPFELMIKPASADVQGGNVATTLSSFGALGYYDYAESGASVGLGFQFPIGTASALYHGGFLVATAANRVSDVSYGRADGIISSHPRYDFATTADGDMKRPANPVASTELRSRFTDVAAESPIGVTVTQTAQAWNEPPNDDFVILQYAIQNTSGATISALYAGFYLDWDIFEPTANFAGWDQENQLGFMHANNSAYYGICTLAPGSGDLSNHDAGTKPAQASSYRAVNNPTYVWPGFTDASKFAFLTGGFSVVASDKADDWSQQIGVGPFALAPQETLTVAFAVLGGTNLDDLKRNAQAARAVYIAINKPATPERFELAQNQPNPFRASGGGKTIIAYTLAKAAAVRIEVFNLLGQEVVRLREMRQDPGRYMVQWDGRDRSGNLVPAGTYFYQVRADNWRKARRMVVLR